MFENVEYIDFHCHHKNIHWHNNESLFQNSFFFSFLFQNEITLSEQQLALAYGQQPNEPDAVGQHVISSAHSCLSKQSFYLDLFFAKKINSHQDKLLFLHRHLMNQREEFLSMEEIHVEQVSLNLNKIFD